MSPLGSVFFPRKREWRQIVAKLKILFALMLLNELLCVECYNYLQTRQAALKCC